MSDSLSDNNDERMIIPVIKESIHVEKDVVETGRLKITKSVTENEENVNVPYTTEKVTVEHVSINEYVEIPPPAIRYEGNTMIIPVLKEVVFVEKRLLLVEEVRVTTHKESNNFQLPVTLRQETVVVQHEKMNDAGQSTNNNI